MPSPLAPRRVALLFLFASALVLANAAPTDRWDAPHAANPILPGYYADPSLVEHDGRFYLYATLDPWGGRTLGCWESSDFKHWTYRELNWPTKDACTSPQSGDSMVWAPSVVRAPNGRFFMFVSVGSEVWVGSAAHPLGPWSDANTGRPLIPHNYRPGFHMIDAEAFIDDDGSAYLYWGSGWNWTNGRCYVVKLRPDMVTFDGEPRDITPTNYFEAPFMLKHEGRYYLSYSQGITIKDTYAVHYAVGDTPFGPFTEASTSPILSTDHARHIVSPGHHALFRHAGRTYILYHRHSVPFVADQAHRQTCIDELRFTADGLIEKITPTHAAPALVQDGAAGQLPAATASSAIGDLHDAARALDDNYATRWTPADDDRAPWLQLDLGQERRITRQELRLEYAWKRYRFTVAASSDGETWTTLTDFRDGIAGSPVIIEAAASARFLRLNFFPGATDSKPALFEWSAF